MRAHFLWKRSYKQLALAGLSSFLALGSAPVMAASLTFDYSTVSGDTPEGAAPWLTALIEDTVTPGKVTITLTSSLKDADEFFTGALDNTANPAAVVFNLKDNVPVTIDGSCLNTPGPGCPAGASLFLALNATNLPGPDFQGFDFALLVGQSTGLNTFRGSSVITYTLTGTGLSAASFNTTNGANGKYCSAAEVGGIGTPATGTAVIAALCDGLPPSSAKVPGPLPILGAGMAFGFSRSLRRRVQTSVDSSQASIG
jgi:hypothetical protein